MSLIGRKEAKYWHNLLMRVWITAHRSYYSMVLATRQQQQEI